ncbi:hypothetical protein JCM3774_003992 [Rhodotorula dairenensis]
MFYHLVITLSMFCASVLAAPLSLLREGGTDRAPSIGPDRHSWFTPDAGGGLFGNLGDVLSASLMDGMGGNTFDFGDYAAHEGPKLPPTRISIDFGVSVDVGELPHETSAR